MHQRIRRTALWMLCIFAAALLSGCRGLSMGTDDRLTGETYPDSEKYHTGAFAYEADKIKAVEVHWRSGEVEIAESDKAKLSVKESGALPEEAALHYLLEDGVLKIRFCASGAKVRVKGSEKRLQLEVPKGIALSVHTTSARVKAETLRQHDILIASFSGSISLGEVTAKSVDLTSSSGAIRGDSVSAGAIKSGTISGSIDFGTVSAEKFDGSASSGFVTVNSLAVKTAEITTAGGRVNIGFAETEAAKIRTVGGNVALMLGQGGAEVLYEHSSGKLKTKRAYEQKGDLVVFGGGACKLIVETTGGNLEIQ